MKEHRNGQQITGRPIGRAGSKRWKQSAEEAKWG
jgi:hypothetical protein